MVLPHTDVITETVRVASEIASLKLELQRLSDFVVRNAASTERAMNEIRGSVQQLKCIGFMFVGAVACFSVVVWRAYLHHIKPPLLT